MSWLQYIKEWNKKRKKQEVIHFHRELYEWHSKTFFPFPEHLSELEQNYIEDCFLLPDSYQEIPDSGYEDYSHYSYSHRIKGDSVNSSRLAYGSVCHHQQAFKSAIPVIEERNIPLDSYFLEHPQSLFYGLGWDFLANHFKVYFRILNLDQLPQLALNALLEETLPDRRSEGLVSFTFIEQELHEQKVYAYPDPKREELPQETKGQAYMATSKRGTIAQYDVSQPEKWIQRINQHGKEIVTLYKDHDLDLDTIAIKDKNDFTIYFP